MTFRILVHETLASTNDEAMARLRAGEPAPFVVTARSQTGGRGRQGRAWTSPEGNLYASLALLDPAPANLLPQLGFVAGVALAKTLRARLGGDTRLAIKWPNDAVFAGAKLAGILLEAATLPDHQLACVIGVGVNCVSHPDGLPYPATDLRMAGDQTAEPGVVLAALTETMEKELGVWNRGSGFAAIRAAWLDLAAGLGAQISVTTQRQTLTGVFTGIDETGRLLVVNDWGLSSVEAGDVFLPGTMRQDDKAMTE